MKIDANIPIIDEHQYAKFNVTSPGLIEELLHMFAKELIEIEKTINQNFADKNLSELDKHLHKLQGGAAYCGLPRLKMAAKNLNLAIRQQTNLDSALLEQVNQEIAAVLSMLREKKIILT